MKLPTCLVAAAAALVPLAGCGGPVLVPLKGRVTCNGKPVADAALIFSPIPKSESDRESAKAAAAGTDADGRFEVSTYKVGDGAIVGKHRVAITLDPFIRSACKSKVIIVEVKPGDTELNIELNQ